MAKEQEEAEQDVGWFAKKSHCPREQEATKGGSCAACKCTDREKKERKRRIGNGQLKYTTSKRVKELEPQPNSYS